MEGHIIEFKDITLNKTIEFLGDTSEILPEKKGYQEFETIYGEITEAYVVIKNSGNIVVSYMSSEDYAILYDAWSKQSLIYIKTEFGKQFQGRIKEKRLGLKPITKQTNGETFYTGSFNITT